MTAFPLTPISALNASCLEPFRDCLSRILSSDDDDKDEDEEEDEEDPICCLIADPMWSFVGDVAQSFNLPRIALRTGAMSSFLVYHSLPLLRDKGYFPLQETKFEEPVPEFPPLKVKDLTPEPLHDLLASLVKESKTSQGIICNTFEELETSSLAIARQALPIPIFPIGPLYKRVPTSTSSLLTEDQTSISWLNTQPPKSVLYVSFGSVAAMSEAEFLEIAWGLANSKQPFLWVVRAGLIHGSDANELLPEGYLEMVSGRGHIVKWAPQVEVLAHPSVGGFWTHCGWNSTLESVCEGVPMICLPFFADQPINARHVSDSWKIGLQLEKGVVNREEIERAIRRLMVEEEGEEMRKRITSLKDKASLCVMEGGSSYKSLECLSSYLLSL